MTAWLREAYPLVLAVAGSSIVGCGLIAGLSDYHHAAGEGGAATSTSTSTGGVVGVPGKWPDSASFLCLDDTFHFMPADTCPDATHRGFGQDGSFSIYPPKYTRVADHVTDEVTGLIWLLGASSDAPWADAAAGCTSRHDDGINTWRLATRLELLTLFDTGRYAPSWDPVFADLGATQVWSSPGPAGSAWVVRLDTGTQALHDVTEFFPQVCVSGPTFSGGFQIVDKGTVFDSRTGLVWQRETAPGTATWLDALQYCLSRNGDASNDASGWRLPTDKELLTLVDETADPHFDKDFFPDTRAGAGDWYWTASPVADDQYEGSIDGVTFKDGYAERVQPTDHHAMRCVKAKP